MDYRKANKEAWEEAFAKHRQAPEAETITPGFLASCGGDEGAPVHRVERMAAAGKLSAGMRRVFEGDSPRARE